MPVRKSHQAPQQSTRVSEFKVQGVQLSNLKGTKPSSTTAEHGQAQTKALKKQECKTLHLQIWQAAMLDKHAALALLCPLIEQLEQQRRNSSCLEFLHSIPT
eukprot:1139657-Pelagomonas_calceolata.AAC.7